MGIVFRQSVKTTIVTLTGAALGAVALYISTKTLTTQQLGYSRLLINNAAILQFVMLLGLGPMIFTYVQRYEKEYTKRKVLTSLGFIIPLISTFIFIVPYFLFKERIVTRFYKPQDWNYVSNYYHWLPVLIVLSAFVTFLESYLLSRLKTAQSSFPREILLRICNIIFIALLYYNYITFSSFIALNALVYILLLVVLIIFSLKTEHFGISLNWSALSKTEYKEIVHFSWYHLLTGVSLYFIGFIDQTLLASLSSAGITSLSTYSIAVYIATLLITPFRAMSNSVFPVLNDAYIQKDNLKVEEIFKRSGVNMLIVGIGMVIIIASNLDNAVAILPDGYQLVKPVALILMIGRIIDFSTGMNEGFISITPWYKFNFRISVVLVAMMLILNWYLIPIYGVYGAAWATTIALSLYNLFKMLFLWTKLKMHPFSSGTGLVFLSGALAVIPGLLIPIIINPVIDTLIRTAIVLVVYSLTLIWLKPSIDLNQYLKKVKAEKRLF
ncbi:MAG: polysaccharide biosynthesis protein [Bacteroidetes bacterium]|nr:polysaccharide biosynthesis protein [Bacteroidota bacterium]